MKVRCYGGLFDGREVQQRDDWPQQTVVFPVFEDNPTIPRWTTEALTAPPAPRPYVEARYKLARTYDSKWVYVADTFHAKEPDGQTPAPATAALAPPTPRSPRTPPAALDWRRL